MSETAQSTAETSVAVMLDPPTERSVDSYDADAPEVRVPFTKQHKSKTFRVAHIFRSPTDEHLLEYERRRNVRMRDASVAELGERGLAMETDAESAAVWLWNKLAVRLEGYVAAENWRDKVSDADKEYAITNGLLACEAISKAPENADENELIDFDVPDATSRIELAFLMNGDEMRFFHDLKEASADDVKTYRSLMRTSYSVRGARLGKSDIRIPSKAKPLADLYDRLLIEADPRYSRVPLNHKMAVILQHLSSENDSSPGN